MATVTEPDPKERMRLGQLIVRCECGGTCKAGSSQKLVTYYYCDKCGKSQKVRRPD